jgi:hypothetical protein
MGGRAVGQAIACEHIFLIVALTVRPGALAEGATKSFGDSQEPFSKGS